MKRESTRTDKCTIDCGSAGGNICVEKVLLLAILLSRRAAYIYIRGGRKQRVLGECPVYRLSITNVQLIVFPSTIVLYVIDSSDLEHIEIYCPLLILWFSISAIRRVLPGRYQSASGDCRSVQSRSYRQERLWQRIRF